jgi:hypothetical protein
VGRTHQTNALQAANQHVLVHSSLLFTCKQNPARLAKFRWVGTVSISNSTRNFTPLHSHATICASETPCKNKGTYYNGLQQKLGNNTEIMQETDYWKLDWLTFLQTVFLYPVQHQKDLSSSIIKLWFHMHPLLLKATLHIIIHINKVVWSSRKYANVLPSQHMPYLVLINHSRQEELPCART